MRQTVEQLKLPPTLCSTEFLLPPTPRSSKKEAAHTRASMHVRRATLHQEKARAWRSLRCYMMAHVRAGSNHARRPTSFAQIYPSHVCLVSVGSAAPAIRQSTPTQPTRNNFASAFFHLHINECVWFGLVYTLPSSACITSQVHRFTTHVLYLAAVWKPSEDQLVPQIKQAMKATRVRL